MTEDEKIRDPDGDEILYRNLVKTVSNDSTEILSECDVIAANARFGGGKLSTAFFRRHAIVRIFLGLLSHRSMPVHVPSCMNICCRLYP